MLIHEESNTYTVWFNPATKAFSSVVHGYDGSAVFKETTEVQHATITNPNSDKYEPVKLTKVTRYFV